MEQELIQNEPQSDRKKEFSPLDSQNKNNDSDENDEELNDSEEGSQKRNSNQNDIDDDDENLSNKPYLPEEKEDCTELTNNGHHHLRPQLVLE